VEMRHVNWNPGKHKRLPNGQWAPTGRGKIVMNAKPRSYASRKSHASQVGRTKMYANHNAKLRPKYTKSAKNNRKRNLLIGAAVVGVAAAGTVAAAHYTHTTLSGGPKSITKGLHAKGLRKQAIKNIHSPARQHNINILEADRMNMRAGTRSRHEMTTGSAIFARANGRLKSRRAAHKK
jgi:hypothetical protein